MQIVFLCHKLDQLITHYECQDNPGDWNDHRFREVSDHRKDAAVPCQRRLSHFTGDLAYFGIDRIEHARQVSRDPLDEQPSEPFIEFVEYLSKSHFCIIDSRSNVQLVIVQVAGGAERRNAEDCGDIAAAYPLPAVCQPFLLGEVFGADQHLGFLPYVLRHPQPLLSRWR